MLTHLRHNAVAYLALAVALSTGSAYAAQELPKKLPKHSVGAKQLKKNAVTGKAVKDGSLTAADFAAGTIPVTATWVGAAPHEPAVPVISSLQKTIDEYDFTVPRSGTLLLSWFTTTLSANCTAGIPTLAIFLDGAPVPTLVSSPGTIPSAVRLSGTVAVTAGAHHAVSGLGGCTSGQPTGSFAPDNDWTATLAP